MLRTGVDLIEVERVESSIARYGNRFLEKIFTDAELQYVAGRSASLAARFAAKEAVSKLLGVGIHHHEGVNWRDIEILAAENGDPRVMLHGRAAQLAIQIGFKEIALSISHTREHAIAFVVAQ